MAMDQGPVCILRPSAHHCSLVEDVAGMAALEAISGEIAVVAIAGNQRGGKSTLMNLLHGRSLSGFQMGHYLDPKTSGVWVWPRPHPWQEGVTVLLMDSEGLDSPHVPHHYNWLLSAITLLASDVFMYQSRGSIEQSQGERLEMILRVATQLSRTGSDQQQSEQPVATFLWLLRDHQLRLRRSPRDELLEKLDRDAQQTLRRCFNDTDCVMLPRPMGSDEDLKKLDELCYNDLSAEFREEYVVLERRLFELLAKPRRVLGGALTGATLSSCLRSFMSAIHGRGGFIEDICSLPSQRELLLKVAGERAVQAGLAAYSAFIASGTDGSATPSLSLLLKMHPTASQAAEAAFGVEASSVGLLASESESFKTLCIDRIAQWETDAPSCEWPASSRLENTAAALVSGMSKSTALSRDMATVPVLCRRGGVLKGGLLHEIWEKQARSSAATASDALADLLGPLHQRLAVTYGTMPVSCAEPFEAVEDVWMELHQVQDAMLVDKSDDAGFSGGPCTNPSSASLTFWGAAAADRVTLSIARREAVSREGALQNEIHSVRDELRAEADGKLKNLEACVTSRASEQAAALTDLARSQTAALEEVRSRAKTETDEVQRAVAGVEASSKSKAVELQSQVEEARAATAAAMDKAHAEAANQLWKVETQMSERLDGQRDDLRGAEVRLKEAMSAAEERLGEKTSGLAGEFKERAQRLQETADASTGMLKKEMHELEKRRQGAELDAQRLLHALEEQQRKFKTALEEGAEANKSDLESLRVETTQQLQQAEERRQVLLALVQDNFKRQASALETFQGEMQQQSSDEHVEHKASFTKIQDQLEEVRVQQKKPIASLESALVEQTSALESLKSSLQKQLRDEEDHRKSCFEGVQQQLRQSEQQQQLPIATLERLLADQQAAVNALQAKVQDQYFAA